MDLQNPFSPFEFALQVDIDGRNWDYVLTVDEMGQVHEAIPAIFELPASSHKMIIGESDGQLERKIRAHAGLFKYLVPLALAGKLPTYQEQLAPLVTVINQRLQEKGLEWGKLHPVALSNSLADEILRCYGENAAESEALQACWDNIIAIIEKQPPWPLDEIDFLGQDHGQVAADFFPAITPFYPLDFQAAFYTHLKGYHAESTKQYLLQELTEPSCTPYASGIIEALEPYISEDLAIYQGVVDFCNRIDLKADLPAAALYLLTHYPLPPTQAICSKILCKGNVHQAEEATAILLSMGMPQAEIVALLLPRFRSGDATVSFSAFSVFAQHISAEYLPGAAEILDVYVQELNSFTRSYSPSQISAIAIKVGIHFMSDRLYDLLAHENEKVRSGILALISGYHKKSDYFSEFLTPPMLDRYWKLCVDPENQIATRAIRLLGKIAVMTKRADYIAAFIAICQNTTKQNIQFETIDAINFILHRLAYQPQIEPFYLNFLQKGTERYWSLVLNGLRLSPNLALKQNLWTKYKDHSDSGVRRAANDLFKPYIENAEDDPYIFY